MQEAKEEVRSRLAIEDVIGEYVQLKRAGRNFKGLSPFNEERTPSFFVSPDKAIWHDFSSNKGGDIFSFIMEVEGLDFRQTLEHLARKAGVDLSMYQSKHSGDIARKKQRLLAAHDLAARYYQQSLVRNKHALDYVCGKRGFNKRMISDFKIGYAPTNGNALISFLGKKGYTKKELTEAGLTNRYGGDLFRGRMMVPLMDSTGRVIGFTARVITDDPSGPKYLNTPQTLLYDKSRHVFGLSQAKEAIRSEGYAVIVEGNLDVISSHQADVCQVVATAGTALTEHHLRALKRLGSTIRLAFDGDKAGLAATERAIPIAQTVGVELAIITMPDGAKDPDELIQLDPQKWRQAINKAEPAIDWVLKQYEKRENINTAAGKRVFTTAALDVIRFLSDPVEQEHYLVLVAERTNTSLETLKSKLERSDVPDVKYRSRKVSDNNSPNDMTYAYQDNLLAAALVDGATHDLFQSVDISLFWGEERQAVASYIISHAGKTVSDTPDELQKYDTYVKILLLKADARYADWSDQDRYFETARLLRQIVVEQKKNQKEILTKQLRDAEEIGDNTSADKIRQNINKLIKEIQRGKKQ